MQERIVYLNGAFVPESEAKVSVLDSGFNAGDGVYDVTRTFRHKPFRSASTRSACFARCATRASTAACPSKKWKRRPWKSSSATDHSSVRTTTARFGRSSAAACARPSAIGWRAGATVTVYSVIVNFPEFASFYVEGAPLVIPSTRRIPPECLESKAKITNKMNHNMASFEAKQADPRAIPLMLDIHGNLSETSAHNFFLVIDGKLCTPSDRNVLGGITKAAIFELAKELRVEVIEGDYTPFDLYNAEEAFLASTSPTFVPIKTVNGAKIGNGAPGPVTLRLIGAWNKMVGADIVDQALSHLEQSERERLTSLWRSKKAA